MRQAGVIQTMYDIVKAHGEVPVVIGIKMDTKESEGSKFIIQIPGESND